MVFRCTRIIATIALMSASSTVASAQQAQSESQPEPANATGSQADTPNPDRPDEPVATGEGLGGGLPSSVAALSFEGTDLLGTDLIDAATDMAGADYVARIDVGAALEGRASGLLVFEDVDAFAEWRDSEMGAFFEPIGGVEAVSMELEIFRPELLRISDAEALLAGLENLSIRYINTGNRADGDADIDAVTVVCTGSGADCKPSN